MSRALILLPLSALSACSSSNPEQRRRAGLDGDRFRRRAAHRRRRPARIRERRVHRRRHASTQVGSGGDVQAPAGRARGSDRQDRHARDHRHAHAPGQHARGARRPVCSARRTYGVGAAMSLGQDTGDCRSRCGTRRSPTPRGFAPPDAASRRRSPGRTDAPYWITDRSGGPQGGAGAGRAGKSTSSRSGSTIATASTRS